MSDEPRSRLSNRPLAACAVAIGFGLPLLYLLSIGPFFWLYASDRISTEQATFGFNTIYAPIVWGARHSDTFKQALERYARWWVELGQPNV